MREGFTIFHYSADRQAEHLPLWKPKDAEREEKTFVVLDFPAPPGCCEYVRSLIDPAIDGRRCIDITYCPKRIFSDPKVFASCPTRLKKLKEKTEI
jgi:hypothetical protein